MCPRQHALETQFTCGLQKLCTSYSRLKARHSTTHTTASSSKKVRAKRGGEGAGGGGTKGRAGPRSPSKGKGPGVRSQGSAANKKAACSDASTILAAVKKARMLSLFDEGAGQEGAGGRKGEGGEGGEGGRGRERPRLPNRPRQVEGRGEADIADLPVVVRLLRD